MNTKHLALRLGLAHGVADAATGFWAAQLVQTQGIAAALPLLITYNILAFAFQPLFGALVDRSASHHRAVVASLAIIGHALATPHQQSVISMGLLAIGSGFFHVSAGALASKITPGKAGSLGLFTAPGVIGLAIGTSLGLLHQPATLPLVFIITACVLLLGFTSFPTVPLSLSKRERLPRYILMYTAGFLLLGVILRSSVWSSYSLIDPTVKTILLIGLAAGFGKLCGGFLADEFRSKRIACWSLPLALACFLVDSAPFILLGVFFLQSSTPIILATVVRRFPKSPAMASGFVLGTTIFLGGALLHFFSPSWILDPKILVTIIIVATGLFYLGYSKSPSPFRGKLGRGERKINI